MIPPEDYPMYQAMMKNGGSFVQALAELLQHADMVNYRKLEMTFHDYFEKYRDVAKHSKDFFGEHDG